MRWSHLFSISMPVLGELLWGANKWDGFMGNCCHSRCCCKTKVSSPILSRMITPMLGAHSIECVNFIHCNLNNQFCQQETHKQLSMDFLSMDYIVDELLVDELHCWWTSCWYTSGGLIWLLSAQLSARTKILKCQNQCYTGWFFLTAPHPAPKSSKCQITWEMPNQITCLSFGVSIWNPSLQTFVCKSKKFLVPKSMSMITKFEKFSWHLSPVKSPYQNACTSMVAGPFAVVCSCLQEQKVLNAISCIIL